MAVLATLSHLRVPPMSMISDIFWITVSSALLPFCCCFHFYFIMSHSEEGEDTELEKLFRAIWQFLWLTIFIFMAIWEAKHWKYLACSYLWVMLKYPPSWLAGKIGRSFSVGKNLQHFLWEQTFFLMVQCQTGFPCTHAAEGIVCCLMAGFLWAWLNALAY